MLTPAQFDELSGPIVELYDNLQESIIKDMARRLADVEMTDTAAWQMQRLLHSGGVYNNVLERLSAITGKSESVLRETFEKYGIKAMEFDYRIYQAAGLNPLPLNLSPAMVEVLMAGLRKTGNVISNLTMSTALASQQAFISSADLAYMQVTSGAFTYQEAIRAGVKSMARQGMTVIHYSGRKDQLDVALRRALLTGVGQTTAEMQLKYADEMGSDLVQTTAHIGARPTHTVWQGQVFSRSGTNKKYPDFVESTGYGSVGGLCGVNCRHHFYPFFEGLSTNPYSQEELTGYANATVTYNDHKMSFYSATQEQRRMEREIRRAKREIAGLEAANLPADTELATLNQMRAELRDFLKQTKLVRQPFREQI